MFLSSSDVEPSNSTWPESPRHNGPTASVVLPSESPSLTALRGAREMKFVVPDDVAQIIQDWARQYLQADPHAGDDGYHVNSLYLDTPGFDTFRRQPGFRRRKFRLRRYGQEPTIWLEVKRKRKGHVRKRRISVAEANLIQRLAQPDEPEWEGTWFRRKLDQRQLQPVCQVTYRRLAWIGTSSTGPIRLTIDGDLFAGEASGWQVPSSPLLGESLLQSRRIVEFKFRDVLPATFRGLIQDLRLEPATFSKYRECVAACVSLSCLTGEGV